MKRMHEQQKTLGVRHERLDVADPQEQLPVYPFNPP